MVNRLNQRLRFPWSD